jgi:hypothetical protein
MICFNTAFSGEEKHSSLSFVYHSTISAAFLVALGFGGDERAANALD